MEANQRVEDAVAILTEHLGEFLLIQCHPSAEPEKVSIRARYRGDGIIPAMVLQGSPLDRFYQPIAGPFDIIINAPLTTWDEELPE